MKISLKIATSLDGCIATSTGDSKWISSPKSREYVQNIRADHDAIITGIGTVLADDPSMNVRLDSYLREQPARIIFDSKLQTPINSKILDRNIGGKPFIFTSNVIDEDKAQSIMNIGANIIKLPQNDVGLDLELAIDLLREFGFYNVLVEAGGTLATSFIKKGLINKIYWFRAPILIGGDGKRAFESLGVKNLSDTIKMKLLDSKKFDDDILETYEIVK